MQHVAYIAVLLHRCCLLQCLLTQQTLRTQLNGLSVKRP